ncbi:PEP-CTERM sorting domain-containing protein [Roseateles sp. DC23W]|uniref:PEP-CTERM sorting domain-containing protein n=1 Tax=Pelomonas dachongensis TaxID=3299029 RepID=A0ABW7ETI4_9BURK
MRVLNPPSLVTLLAGFALALPLAAHAYSASVFTRAGAGVSVIGAPGSTEHAPADRSASTTTVETLSLVNAANALSTYPLYTASAAAHASASVAPGVVSLRASGYGGGTASPPTYGQSDSTGYAYAWGGFNDSMTLDIAGVAAGTLVEVDFSMRFDGVANVTHSSVAGGWGKGGGDYHWLLQVTSAGWGAGMLYDSGTRTLQVDEYGNVTFNSLDFGSKSFTALLMTGAPLGLNAWAWAQAFGRGGFGFCPGCTDQMAGAGDSVMGGGTQSLSWNGVQGVRLNGSAVNLSTVSLVSQTGLDLMAPVTAVPEPMSALLMGLGLSVLAVARRRRPAD